jgi:putative ABC transport system permease protein
VSAPEPGLARWREQAVAHALFGLRTATEAVRHNTLRAFLTSLGIMFGVASVIAMLAIGKGAEQEVLAQMKLLGSNNVVITPLVEQKEEQVTGEPTKEVKRFSPGLSYADAQSIPRMLPGIEASAAEVVYNTSFTRDGLRRSGKVVGVDTSYFRILNLDLAQGQPFSTLQVEHGLPVAIIGHGVRTRFFSTTPPVGSRIKVGEVWLTVVGVLADRRVSGDAVQRLGIRDANMDIYIPVRTMLRRIRDRAQLTQRDIELASRPEEVMVIEAGGADQAPETDEQRLERTNRNQLDRIILRVADSRQVGAVADVVQRALTRRHNGVVDFEITVPELLLRQEQRTRTIFNIVLGAIASISLVVGGIGIMNIMLASVLERIREIGVRRAVGATRRDIGIQFLSEAVLISLAGGIAGVILGTLFSFGIQRFAEIDTIISGTSVAVAFGVSCAVGIAFGIVPARRAAMQDPITSLRYE